MADAPGFRTIDAGEVTRGIDVFAGLDDDAPRVALGDRVVRVRQDLCSALFGSQAPVDGQVRIASFSDYNCPYCRVLTEHLSEAEARAGGALRVTWHELPLLGPTSRAAARAAMAADLQGAYAAFHKRLMRSRFQPDANYLTALAQSLDLDAERLLADAASDATADPILTARALAQVFGFIGTPALVVERTAILGRIPVSRLDKLIAVERREGPLVCDIA